jgi:uncharacterized protein
MHAEWRQLLMLSFEIDPDFLNPWVPAGLELSYWKQKTFITLVGLLNRNVRFFGLPIPFHRKFEQVNLRFYIRRKMKDEERLGVMFIKQVVPRKIVAAGARYVYREQVVSLPMKHEFEFSARRREEFSASYSWHFNGRWNELSAKTKGISHEPKKHSLEKFIAERYWGYSGMASNEVLEYQVEHPIWSIREVGDIVVEGSLSEFYGKTIGRKLKSKPDCAFLADGSEARLYAPVKLW